MAEKSVLASLGSKLKAAHEKHANDETKFDTNGNLPAGIENGIAKLIVCKFDVYKDGNNKGKPYFRAEGIVVAPKELNNIPIEGLRTNIMEPLCDTKNMSNEVKTLDEHLAIIYNHLRLLGVNTADVDPDELETVVQELQESQPYFRFRTWKGEATKLYPNPRVNHVWNGVVDYTEDNTTEAEAVDDETPEAKAEPVKTTKKAEPSKTQPTKTVTKSTPPKTTVKTTKKVEKAYNENDLDSILAAANAGDTNAQILLNEKAIEAGLTEEDLASIPDWDTTAKTIKDLTTKEPEDSNEESTDESEETSTETEETPEEVPEQVPEVDEVYNYLPLGQKKIVEVQVVKVDAVKKTVNIKNMAQPKIIYPNVPWNKLKS
jgi:hypothetical protein